MVTKVKFLPTINETRTKDEIWSILCECDQEFVPTLSSRKDPLQCGLTNSNQGDSLPHNYFYVMLQQAFILVADEDKDKDKDEDKIVGFMSFIHNYSNREVGIDKCNYISTLCVKKEYRNQGLAKKMYEFLINNVEGSYQLSRVGTRTWSGNYGHIRLIERLGFDLVCRLKNHRGPGIDTVYYLYDRTNNL